MPPLEASTTIPPSPTSPPPLGLKRRRLSDPVPESPLSPPLMSVATKSYVSPYGNTQHTNETAPPSSSRSPRGSSSFTQPPPAPPLNHSLPTPASSVAGIPGLDMVEEADQHRDKRQRLEEADREAGDAMAGVESSILPTNHDRHQDVPSETGDSAGLQATHTAGGATAKFAIGRPAVSRETALEQLQEDMGEAFLLCRSKVERQRPDPQKHLLALYGLSPLLKSVARTDPLTGEKINKLRKSYEGQIKSFGLAGKNKPVKGERNVDEDEPGPLRRMTGSLPQGLIPDGQWRAVHATKQIEVTPDFRAKLQAAMQMQPGSVRDNAKWEDVLGFEKSRPVTVQPQPNVAQIPPPRRLPNGVIRPPQQQPPPQPTVSEAKRQTRGKKRSYGDDSFVGYGEGYSDLEDLDHEGDESAMRRKRKKVATLGQDGGVD